MVNVYVSLLGLLNAGNSTGSSRELDLIDSNSSQDAILEALERAHPKEALKPEETRILASLDEVLSAGVDGLHLEVIDDIFLKQHSPFNPVFTKDLLEFLRPISKDTQFPVEAHILLDDPEEYIEAYRRAGANRITLPYSMFTDKRAIPHFMDSIKNSRMPAKAGVSFAADAVNDTGIEFNLLTSADYISVICSGPGNDSPPPFPGAPKAVRYFTEMKKKFGLSYELVADGGIRNYSDAKKLILAGADSLVVGSAMFRSKDYRRFVEEIRSASSIGGEYK
ncbi:hypothetical protein ACFL3V_06940 [Nanoarchaeota archaeon]